MVSGDQLLKFSDYLQTASLILKRLNHYQEINNQRTQLIIASRLPDKLRNKWKDKAYTQKTKTGDYPNMDALITFIEHFAGQESDPVLSQIKASVNRSANAF